MRTPAKTCRGPSLAALLALVLAAPIAAADDLAADTARGKDLLAEGDRLADKGETTEAVLRYKKAFEQILPGMRKIRFKHEVKGDVAAREDLRARLIKEIDEEIPPAEFRGNELGMKALGLIPHKLDLKETMIRILTEEIAAFYDPHTKTMYLIKEPAKPKNARPVSPLAKLFGARDNSFDKDENKVVIAHELTHALDDQNFDLEAMQKQAKGDDDRDLALSALIEGEATLVMFGAQMSDWSGREIARRPAEQWDRALNLMSAFMPLFGGRSVREAPPILSESLIFPYLRGMVFCSKQVNDGGWEALDAAYHEPPLSTEQIIHPEKYRKQPDPPTAVDLGELVPPDGWKEAGRNVVGEMQLAVLLRNHGGRRAAAGWDGDTFAVFEGPGGRLGLVWASTWDSEADAREFAREYLRFQTGKLGPDVKEPDAFPDSTRRPNEGVILAVERRGADVAVVEGFASEPTEAFLEAAFKAKKTEKTRDTPAPRAPRREGKPAETREARNEAG